MMSSAINLLKEDGGRLETKSRRAIVTHIEAHPGLPMHIYRNTIWGRLYPKSASSIKNRSPIKVTVETAGGSSDLIHLHVGPLSVSVGDEILITSMSRVAALSTKDPGHLDKSIITHIHNLSLGIELMRASAADIRKFYQSQIIRLDNFLLVFMAAAVTFAWAYQLQSGGGINAELMTLSFVPLMYLSTCKLWHLFIDKRRNQSLDLLSQRLVSKNRIKGMGK